MNPCAFPLVVSEEALVIPAWGSVLQECAGTQGLCLCPQECEQRGKRGCRGSQTVVLSMGVNPDIVSRQTGNRLPGFGSL